MIRLLTFLLVVLWANCLSAQTVTLSPPGPIANFPCASGPGSVISSYSVVPSTLTVTLNGDIHDFSLTGTNVVVSASGIAPANCATTQSVSVVAPSGGSASGGLTIQIASGTAVPAPAQAAGFTTCIVCMDFTATTGGVVVNGVPPAGVNAAQANTWLDCAGASSPIWFHQYAGHPIPSECPTIASDAGTSVLQTIYTVADQNASFSNNTMTLYDPAHARGIAAPTNYYYELTVKVSGFPTHGYLNGNWAGGGGEVPQYNQFEFDSFEINDYPSSGAAGFVSNFWDWSRGIVVASNWYQTQPPNYPGGNYDPTSGYHTVGMRITSDGISIYKCMWLDGTFINCVNPSVSSSLLTDNPSRMQLYLSLAGYNGQTMSGTMTSNIKSVNIWSCAAWATTACKTSSPDPGGY